MIYDFMRLLLLFDLPVITKNDRRNYSKFRKYLIANGYQMLQFSVYCKIFANREAVINHVNVLQKSMPPKGQIRVMMITEKQFNKMEVILGGKTTQEKTINSSTFTKI